MVICRLALRDKCQFPELRSGRFRDGDSPNRLQICGAVTTILTTRVATATPQLHIAQSPGARVSPARSCGAPIRGPARRAARISCSRRSTRCFRCSALAPSRSSYVGEDAVQPRSTDPEVSTEPSDSDSVGSPQGRLFFALAGIVQSTLALTSANSQLNPAEGTRAPRTRSGGTPSRAVFPARRSTRRSSLSDVCHHRCASPTCDDRAPADLESRPTAAIARGRVDLDVRPVALDA